MDPQKLNQTLNRVGQLLVGGMYDEIAQLTNNQHLTSEELREAVLKYGRHQISPPEAEWKPRSLVELERTAPQAWSVYVALWTLEEGRSDLTLELTLRDSDDDIYRVEVDNLHVL
jgi:hypothetical protein